MEQPKRVLVVDDEPRYLRLLEANLATEGYEVVKASNGQDALDIFSRQKFDLVILDIMMPGVDGFTVCERIRAYSDVPIIMVTARGEEADRVRGLDLGADDYIVKPFSATELLARARAVLRRAKSNHKEDGLLPQQFQHGDLRIDFARAEVWRGDQEVQLSATEYRLLLQFVQHYGRVLSSEELLTNVWGAEYRNDREILWVTIARLRQKLEADPHNPRHIVTRTGLGYLMPPLED
jgi:DNA-binding response OmpR family regulator